MSTFRFPTNDFDRPAVLLNVLGGFWSGVYSENNVVSQLAAATGQLAQQTYLNFLELLNSVSRFNIPLYHRENWYALVVKQSELNATEHLISRYSAATPIGYTPTAGLQYGTPASLPDYFLIRRPQRLARVRAIFNRLVVPSVELVENVDYVITPAGIALRENPFHDARFAKREILNAAGEVVDIEIVLWLYCGDWDWEFVYSQFGYALQLKMQTSEGYKQIINAIFDAFNFGTGIKQQQAAIAAAFGVPLILEPEETIHQILSDSRHVNVITDSHVYQFPLSTTVLKNVGDKVRAGDSITDLLQVFELNRGQVPDIASLAAGPELLSTGYYGDLSFANMPLLTSVEENVAGFTKLTFPIGGFPGDVEKFWADVHAAGIQQNQTLAMRLDVRETPVGQPTAASLPTVINPLQFLIQQLLRNNVAIVKLKCHNGFSPRLSFFPADQFRKIQPPHSMLLFLLELQLGDTAVVLESSASATQSGYNETATSFACVEALTTVTAPIFVAEKVRTFQIGGRCV